MTRKLSATLVLAACLALTGCDEAEDAPEAKPPAAPYVSPQERFLESVEGIESWKTDGPTNEEITIFPPAWCRALAEGHSVEWMLEGDGADQHYPIGWDWGTHISDARQVVLLGVSAYCPANKPAVLEELRTGGDY